MNSKKAITLLVLTTMLLALVPLVPVNAAVTIATIDRPGVAGPLASYRKGHVLEINGTGVTAGATVNVYWDNALKETFSSGTGKMNSTTADATGGFSVWIKVPEAVRGSHYVWAKDVSTGQTYGGSTAVVSEVVVEDYIKLSPTSGLPGDTITISGYGFGDEVTLTSISDDFMDSTPAALDATYSPSTPTTTELGSWTATFKIPATTAYAAAYVITATEGANTATANLKVGASITLNKDEGPTGTVVDITGRGFTKVAPLPTVDTGDVLFGATAVEVTNGPVTVKSDGTFKITIVIPQAAAKGDYTITVTENGGAGLSATDTFTVDGLAKIKATPSYGPQGSTITVEGWNFTKISNTEVVVTLAAVGSKTFKTDSNGYFKGSYTVPAVASGTQTLQADQTTYSISATKNFRAGLMVVILSPSSGPAGTKVGLSGTGFTNGGAYNVTFGGDTVWVDTDNAVATEISQDSLYVPSVAPGVYTVSVWDVPAEIEVLVTFTVTDNTKASTSPVVAPQDYNVTLSGTYFSQDSLTSLEFVIFNSSSYWDMDVYTGPDTAPVAVALDDDGNFTGWWNFNLETLPLSIGAYTINVTDGHKLYTQIPFSVVDKTVQITARKSTFRIGETVAFDIESSFAMDGSYIKVWDPAGNLYWRTADFDIANNYWLSIGTTEVVPYYLQTAGQNLMTLQDDAPLGVYTWKFYYDGDVVDSGSFTVAAAAADVIAGQVTDLANQITDLADQLDSVSSEFDSVTADIAAVRAVAQQAVTAAQQAAQAVQTVAQTANQANTAAQNAADAANAAKDAANSLTTLVYGAIGAALVAALAAIVSLMQISRRIAG